MKVIKRIITVGCLSLLLSVSFLPAAEVKLPGNLDNFVSYMKSYSAGEGDLIYHLNETLLFQQKPSFEAISGPLLDKEENPRRIRAIYRWARTAYKSALHMTLTHRIMRIIVAHRQMKEYLSQSAADPSKTISLDLNQPREHKIAELLLQITGLILYKDPGNKYCLMEVYSDPDYDANHYYRLLGINSWKLEKQLNRTQRFDLDIREFTVHIPWDLEFLQQITGLVITPANFGEILCSQERFRLLLGLLYRLSDAEIDYISGLGPDLAAWKQIYSSDQFLTGLFILSHALRVKNGRLLFPGHPNPNAPEFWNKSVGIDYQQYPLQFLEQLATKDEGKLCYFYAFTFFLPAEQQKAVLFHFNHEKFREIYHLVQLDKEEKIKGLDLPVLKNLGFFTLLYAVQTRNGEIYFPGGGPTWAEAIGAPDSSWFEILKHLLSTSGQNHSLNRFIPIYSKFFHRPEILIKEVIRACYKNYLEYNIAIDFIEKIPLKKPQTVLNLLFWAKSLESPNVPRREKEALVAVLQCILEILAQKAKTMPTQYNYDQLVEELMAIPLSGASLYDGIFRYFANSLGIDLTGTGADDAFFDFLLPADPEVVIYNQSYRLELSPVIKQQTTRILASQSATSLSHLVKINRLLGALQKSGTAQEHKTIGRQLFDAFLGFHLIEEIEPDVPVQLRYFLENHSSDRLFERLHRLVGKKIKNAPQPEIDNLIAKIKGDSLLQELKHYLLTCLYGITLKDSKFQVFLNPNFTRFHDFSFDGEKSPWNHSRVAKQPRNIGGYSLTGGLSRLNITLAHPFSEHVFGREIGYEPTQGIPIVFNHLDLFPYPLMQRAQEYNGLLVKFAEELLQKSWENLTIKQALQEEVMAITSGYHYRTIMAQLAKPKPKKEKFNNPLLYFSELLQIGETFFKKEKLLEQFSQKQQLEAFREPNLYKLVQEEMNQLGSIYYYTFGTLKSYRYSLFPVPLSLYFASQWTCAEMINELKVKAAYISYLRQMPAKLLGSVIYHYLYLAAEIFFRSSQIDYNRTYFMCSVFSYLYLNQIYNDFRKQGILRII